MQRSLRFSPKPQGQNFPKSPSSSFSSSLPRLSSKFKPRTASAHFIPGALKEPSSRPTSCRLKSPPTLPFAAWCGNSLGYGNYCHGVGKMLTVMNGGGCQIGGEDKPVMRIHGDMLFHRRIMLFSQLPASIHPC